MTQERLLTEDSSSAVFSFLARAFLSSSRISSSLARGVSAFGEAGRCGAAAGPSVASARLCRPLRRRNSIDPADKSDLASSTLSRISSGDMLASIASAAAPTSPVALRPPGDPPAGATRRPPAFSRAAVPAPRRVSAPTGARSSDGKPAAPAAVRWRRRNRDSFRGPAVAVPTGTSPSSRGTPAGRSRMRAALSTGRQASPRRVSGDASARASRPGGPAGAAAAPGTRAVPPARTARTGGAPEDRTTVAAGASPSPSSMSRSLRTRDRRGKLTPRPVGGTALTFWFLYFWSPFGSEL